MKNRKYKAIQCIRRSLNILYSLSRLIPKVPCRLQRCFFGRFKGARLDRPASASPAILMVSLYFFRDEPSRKTCLYATPVPVPAPVPALRGGPSPA